MAIEHRRKDEATHCLPTVSQHAKDTLELVTDRQGKMNRITRIAVATVIGFGLSRVMPPENEAKADAEAPELHPIVVSLKGAPSFKWSSPGTPYLDSLRTRFDLDEITQNAQTDLDRVKVLSRWVHTQWDHDGENVARHSDPISILEEAGNAGQFTAVEYATVLSGAINSVGVPARILNLKTADSEVRPSGAGHVVTEAYLRDARRWVMVDGQYDVIPTVYGKAVNAHELRKAMKARSAGVIFNSNSGTHPGEYARWIAPYLHFMDARLDQRLGVVGDSRTLMLIPAGTKPPRAFHRAPLKNPIYTTAPAAFYPTPVAARTAVKPRIGPAPVAVAAPRAGSSVRGIAPAPAVRTAG